MHLDQTQNQIKRLDEIFGSLGKNPKGKKCKGMQGLLEEGEEMMSEDADPDVMDAGLIAAAQRVEHYEISAYGTARAYARVLGDEKAASLLDADAPGRKRDGREAESTRRGTDQYEGEREGENVVSISVRRILGRPGSAEEEGELGSEEDSFGRAGRPIIFIMSGTGSPFTHLKCYLTVVEVTHDKTRSGTPV